VSTKYRRHLYIPDCQVRPGVRIDHLRAISNYIEEKRFDYICCLGDFADMPSLSTHSMASEKEGQRYQKDVHSAREAMNELMAWRPRVKHYRPRLEMLLGNHDGGRIERTLKENPQLEGVISVDDLQYEKHGWRVNKFLKVVRVDGVEASHYFVSGPMGRPISSAANMLRERQSSCIQGHVQSFQMAVHPKTQKTAIMAGTAYLHRESYLTPQGQDHKRQVVVLSEVRDGRCDAMFVSLSYLIRKYG
jgi:hypothetical protein